MRGVDETEVSKADLIFESAYMGEGYRVDSPVPITVGPLAGGNDPLEDPVEAQKRARAQYTRDLASRGLREDDDGEIIEINKVAAQSFSGRSASGNKDEEQTSDDNASSVVDANKKHKPKMTGKGVLQRLLDKKKGELTPEQKEEKELEARAAEERMNPFTPEVTPAQLLVRAPLPVYTGSKVASALPLTPRVPATGVTKVEPSMDDESTEVDSQEPVESDETEHEEQIDAPAEPEEEKIAGNVERTKAGGLVLALVGLPGAQAGDWLWEMANAGVDKLMELHAAQNSENAKTIAVAHVMEANPNPFTLAGYLSVLFGESWFSWEPETITREIARLTGRAPPAMDRILALKLAKNKPDVFFKTWMLTEKMSIAFTDTTITPGDLEDLPPEWIATALAVLRSQRAPGENEPTYSDMAALYVTARLVDAGYVLAPTTMLVLDPLLDEQLEGVTDLRTQVLNGYIQALKNGPMSDEDPVSIQVNRLLACHVVPLRVLAEN